MLKRSRLFAGLIVLIVALPSFTASAANRPADHMMLPMLTHPTQGPVNPVEGSMAKLRSDDYGVTAEVVTHGLTPGHAVTFWVAYVNNPAACSATPCTPADTTVNFEATESNVVYSGGRVIRSHTEYFRAHIPVDTSVGGWFNQDLTNPRGAEVHVIINDHGPLISEMARNQTGSFRGGCTTESLLPGMPQSAIDDGIPGPNACRFVQFQLFVQG